MHAGPVVRVDGEVTGAGDVELLPVSRPRLGEHDPVRGRRPRPRLGRGGLDDVGAQQAVGQHVAAAAAPQLGAADQALRPEAGLDECPLRRARSPGRCRPRPGRCRWWRTGTRRAAAWRWCRRRDRVRPAAGRCRCSTPRSRAVRAVADGVPADPAEQLARCAGRARASRLLCRRRCRGAGRSSASTLNVARRPRTQNVSRSPGSGRPSAMPSPLGARPRAARAGGGSARSVRSDAVAGSCRAARRRAPARRGARPHAGSPALTSALCAARSPRRCSPRPGPRRWSRTGARPSSRTARRRRCRCRALPGSSPMPMFHAAHPASARSRPRAS